MIQSVRSRTRWSEQSIAPPTRVRPKPSVLRKLSAQLSARPSSPGEFHPEALTEPCLTVSGHTARAIHRELPPPKHERSVPPVTG